jgi:beta-glucosidase
MDTQWYEAAKELTARMTLEEKAGLCSGKDFWHLKGIERLDLPEIMVADGPHGLRKQAEESNQEGLRPSVPSTCFPPAVTMASTWDPALIETLGRALAEECREEGVSVVLGPGANIKRSPLCGRNFEYFSEDPFLTGEMALAHIRGVQREGIGTSLKHVAVNNQETNRLFVDAVVDERTLREIYLPGFEKAVCEGQPDTVMCSYNRLNGTYCSENEYLLTTILRDQWGFRGMVVSDWGAVSDRVKGIQAGLELEMPSSQGENDRKIIEAVTSGALSEELLDRAVVRITALILKAAAFQAQHGRGEPDRTVEYDREEHHRLARTIAAEGMVLLKNRDNHLPITCSEKTRGSRIAVIGEFARNPRYQGAGSSQVNPTRLDSALNAVTAVAQSCGMEVVFARGYEPDAAGTPDSAETSDMKPKKTGPRPVSADLIAEACRLAESADRVLLFAGLPDSYESEGFDRTHLRLPDEQNELITAVAAVNPRTAVILSNGAPVEMPWADSVPAVLETYLGGQAGGSAAADVLFGRINPSGRLAETFPLSLSDTPCFEQFPGGRYRVLYREGLHVGYRWYASAGIPVLFPFGHGLSYTTFSYRKMELSSQELIMPQAGVERVSTLDMADSSLVDVSVTVENTGRRSGKEVVQVYVRKKDGLVYRPDLELRGFIKVLVDPGEQVVANIALTARAFAFFDTAADDWAIEAGTYEILAGSSSESIHLTAAVQIRTDLPEEKEKAAETPGGHIRETTAFIHPEPDGRTYTDAAFTALLGRDIPEDEPLEDTVTLNTPLQDIRGTAVGDQLYEGLLAGLANMSASHAGDVSTVADSSAISAADGDAAAAERARTRQNQQKMIRMFERIIEGLPLRGAFMYSRGAISLAQLEDMVSLLNQERRTDG